MVISYGLMIHRLGAKALSTIRFQLGVASPVLAEKALAETMGKAWENHGKMVVLCGLMMVFHGIL